MNLQHEKTTLDNGLRIISARLPHTRSVSVCIFIAAGSRYETDAEGGVSHFIEHLLFKGTPKRPTSKEISEAIEGVGGILNGGTNKELTVYWCKVAQPHFSLALDTLVDLLLNSKFDPQEIERERQVIIEEINQSKDSPAQEVNILIDGLLWPDHPLGRDVAGRKESVRGISREMMLGFMTEKYLPASTVVTIAGDMPHMELVAAVDQAMGRWTNLRTRPQYLPFQEQASPRVLIETRDTEQVHLCLGLPGLSLFHPQRFVLDLLNIILGEGMSSRLFTEVRDKLGLAYSIYSYADHFLDSGSVTVYAGAELKNLKAAISAILEQLARLREPVPESEVYKAKELAKGRLLLRMEDTRNVASWLGGQEVLTERIYSIDEVISIIDAITIDELRQLAWEIIVGSRLRLAVVGNIAADEPLDELLRV